MSRILIAEDEYRIACFIEKGLRKKGFCTAIAPDGQQAIQMALSGDFDLLLLDLGLPEKDGWEVLEELRSQGEQIPVIIVSAQAEIENKQGVNDYLKKPFRFNNLLERIHISLQKSE
ncbi:MAG: response regulator [Symploca sp. SIO1B1]|nr:response regulator [Symploca sp. SIO1C2]NER98044.1 response regulator [Symploca sp. SIO1B1]